MSLPKQVFRQKDFSAGEIDDHGSRRDDTPMMRAGCRQALNKHILPTGALDPRPGRFALFEQSNRTDAFTTLSGLVFYISFEAARVKVRDAAGTVVLNAGGLPWTVATVQDIVWARYQDTIYICFPGMQPRTLTYSGVAWAIALYAPRTTSSGQKRTPFRRFSPGGITLDVSAIRGTVDIAFSDDVLTSGYVGTRLRYQGRQMTVLSVTNARAGKAKVEEKLYWGTKITFTNDPSDTFALGEVVEGEQSEAKGEVSAFPSETTMLISRSTSGGFDDDERIIGPNGRMRADKANNKVSPPKALAWDEEIFNSFRGWPQSVTVDQNRLIFTDFPSLQAGIAWSAVDLTTDLYPDADPDDAMFELLPGAARVYHVLPGYDEFVMTSAGVFYIPISESNPLKPGSVAFRNLSVDPVARIRPAVTSEGVVYFSEGLDKVVAIRATGQTARPYLAVEISEFHRHLLTGPKTIIACTGAVGFPDRCVMVLNTDGSVIVGRLNPQLEWVGWVPWRNAAANPVMWISARNNQRVLFTTQYSLNVLRQIVEAVDVTSTLDCVVNYAAPPAALAAPVGKGPLWFIAGATVYLMDNRRPMDTRVVDANGFLVAIEGEDLSSATLLAGFSWEEVFEPFIPHPPEGRSSKQTLRKRKIVKIAVKAEHATGFEMANRRVPAWLLGDDMTLPPTLRNEVKTFKPAGRSYDPRAPLLKDIPGPMRLIEVSGEVTV
jgi:hypothetical protein